MSSALVQSNSSGVTRGQETKKGGIMGSSDEVGSLGLQRTASQDMGAALPGSFGNASQGGGLQRTMSRDVGAGLQPVGGGLQRTMSGAQPGGLQRTVSGAQPGGLQRTVSGAQPGGLQRTMSRDLGAAGAPSGGGLQRTMSRDIGNAQPGGGLQRTMSKGLGNVPSGELQRRDTSRQPRKDRVPRSAGGQDSLPRHKTTNS